MIQLLKDKKHLFALLSGRLDAQSPLKRLSEGYAYVTDEQGQLLDSVQKVRPEDRIKLTLLDGTIRACVEDVKENAGKEGTTDG